MKKKGFAIETKNLRPRPLAQPRLSLPSAGPHVIPPRPAHFETEILCTNILCNFVNKKYYIYYKFEPAFILAPYLRHCLNPLRFSITFNSNLPIHL